MPTPIATITIPTPEIIDGIQPEPICDQDGRWWFTVFASHAQHVYTWKPGETDATDLGAFTNARGSLGVGADGKLYLFSFQEVGENRPLMVYLIDGFVPPARA